MSALADGVDDINSNDIKQEIIRFESVHPSIYALYDLIETMTDRRHAEMFRRQVASVEDAFVNSQEWTLGHSVPEIKLGLLGSVQSGKSALVHRYLTGSYLKDESPEGGRFKKEVVLDGLSNLLLIRDEGGAPDEQFSRWIDGVVFVFSLNSEESFRIVCDYFERLDSFRETIGLPIILVGTQDSTAELNSRVIDDAKARRLACSLNKSPYYETSSTYGHNVERVFQDACIKVVQSRPDLSYRFATNTPQAPRLQNLHMFYQRPQPHYPLQQNFSSYQIPQRSYHERTVPQNSHILSGITVADTNLSSCLSAHPCGHANTTSRTGAYPHLLPSIPIDNAVNGSFNDGASASALTALSTDACLDMHNNPGFEPDFGEDSQEVDKEVFVPGSTPFQSHQARPKSNLFRKAEEPRDKEKKMDGIGSGRSIPVKQGYLFKRTCKPLNKEWKTKKYVSLTEDARLVYHPSIQDYVQNVHGKEIDLSRVTVKIPGITFRQTGGQALLSGHTRTQAPETSSDKLSGSTDNTNAGLDQGQTPNESGVRIPPQQSSKETSKRRNRRVKASQKSGGTDGYESEEYEFQLISMDRQWNFETHNSEDRDEWVAHIDQAIITRLQLLESSKRIGEGQLLSGGSNGPLNSRDRGGNSMTGGGSSDPGCLNSEKTDHILVDETLAKALRSVAGNKVCADCGSPNPDWASINLGELVCIQCSGVHRKLGTHISRIRSIMLDDWTAEATAVMRAIGNTLANSVWEAAVPGNAANQRKPDCRSSKEEMEAWIRAKYEYREFLPPLPYPEAPLQQQLIDAIARQDTRQVILCLARATPDTVNAPYSRHDPRAAIHIAATLGNIVYLQLLLWYNGNPNVVDAEGRNAFYYAHCSYHVDCASFLLRNGCPRQAVPVPLPGFFPINTAAHQQSSQSHHQRPPPQPVQHVGVKSPPAVNPMTPKHPNPAFQHQQQQKPHLPQSMAYRGGAVATGMSHSSSQGVTISGQMPNGFAPVYLHNIMPVGAPSTGMHGTMSGNGMASQMSPATVGAGATLPRRRGPFHPQSHLPQGFLPPPPCSSGSSVMCNRPLPTAGGFDVSSGCTLMSGVAATSLLPSLSSPLAGNKTGDGGNEIGL